MFPYYLIGYLVGAVVIYLWLRNQNKIVSFNDFVITTILTGVLGVVYAFGLSAMHINLNHWFLALASVFVGVLFSYKLFEKRK